MARPSGPKKLAAWRERLERFSHSGLAVAQFCARESVSVASFYPWRKKLGHKSGRPRRTDRRGVFEPVTVVPTASGARRMHSSFSERCQRSIFPLLCG